MAYTWLAVRDAEPAEVFEQLDLVLAGDGHAAPPFGLSHCRAVDDWVVVIAFGSRETDALDLKQAQRLSSLEEVYYFFRYDVANVAELAHCRHGEVLWQLEYHAGSARGVHGRGELPPAIAERVDELRAALVDDEGIEQSGATQGAIEDLAAACTGFSLQAYHSWNSEEELQRAEAEAPFVELEVSDE
jgi:hypothetical protein